MPVPDEIVFGPDPSDPDHKSELNYGNVRALRSDLERVKALRARIQKFLVEQSAPMAREVYAPFPLAVITCVGIEALGQIRFGDKGHGGIHFQDVLSVMDSRFSAPLDSRFKPSRVKSCGCLHVNLLERIDTTVIRGMIFSIRWRLPK